MTSALHPDQVEALLRTAGPGSSVHLIGAGGCGMSALGHLLLDLGHAVTGSDLLANEETGQLQARGAVIRQGHSAALPGPAQPVLVVHTSAVGPSNPEFTAALQLGIPVVRRAVLLAALLLRQRGVSVAGMHGKTTTTALLAFALKNLGARPSYAVGALVPQLPCHAHFSEGGAESAPWFVIETDESDGTLNQFRPEHAILLNVDAEHLDHFAGLAAVCEEFRRFAAGVSGLRVYCKDDASLCRMLDDQPRAISYGFHAKADYRAELAASDGPDLVGAASPGELSGTSSFTVWHRERKLGEFRTGLIGAKNVSNATAVIALLHRLGYGPEVIAKAVAGFRGAARRQELLYADDQVRVFDDYGHHPSEIRATLRAFRAIKPARLLVAFQPHRFTRTQCLLEEFATAFEDADQLWLTRIYAASEPPIAGVDSALLARRIQAHGQAVEHVPEMADLGAAVLRAIRPGDLVLFLGAGDITGVAHTVAQQLEGRPPRHGAERNVSSACPSTARSAEPLLRVNNAILSC